VGSLRCPNTVPEEGLSLHQRDILWGWGCRTENQMDFSLRFYLH
jgi:hypothetical protein